MNPINLKFVVEIILFKIEHKIWSVIFIAQVRVNGSYKFKIEKVHIKGFAPTPCISLSSGAWVANILNQEFCLYLLANSAPEEREIQGCGGEPFNLNFLNLKFVGPINSYLGYNSQFAKQIGDIVIHFESTTFIAINYVLAVYSQIHHKMAIFFENSL